MAQLMGFERLVSDVLADIEVRLRAQYDNGIWEMLGCGSPIEKLLLIALHVKFSGFPGPLPHDSCVRFFKKGELPELADGGMGYSLQCKLIGEWPVDIYIVVKGRAGSDDLKLVVECDGHDFHERTKEQAARDRSRDRELQSRGYVVFRFTGSEIYRDPMAAAEQICGHIIRFMIAQDSAQA